MGSSAFACAVASLALVMAAAACTTQGPAPEPTPPGPTYAGAELPPLTAASIEPDPSFRLRSVVRATVIGDVMVLAGKDPAGKPAVAALEPATGKVRWQVHGAAEELTIAGGRGRIDVPEGWAWDDRNGGMIVEPYREVTCGGAQVACDDTTRSMGIVARSVADRSVKWSTPITVPGLPQIAAVGPAVVVVNVTGTGVGTIGLDARTGKELWSIASASAQVLAGDTVLAVRRKPAAEEMEPVAFDAHTGRELWRLPSARRATWVSAQPDLGVLETQVRG